jgi:Leucine-rich repeat (LRR) protein
MRGPIVTIYYTNELIAAVQRAKDGDIIGVAPGDYKFDSEFVFDKCVTIRAKDRKNKPRIEWKGTSMQCRSRAIVLDGIIFVKPLIPDDSPAFLVERGNVLFYNCELSCETGHGIVVQGSGCALLYDTTVVNCVGDSIRVSGEEARCLVDNSRIQRSTKCGINVSGNAQAFIRQSNISANETGILSDTTGTIVVQKCDIIQNKGDGFLIQSTPSLASIFDNKIHHNGNYGLNATCEIPQAINENILDNSIYKNGKSLSKQLGYCEADDDLSFQAIPASAIIKILEYYPFPLKKQLSVHFMTGKCNENTMAPHERQMMKLLYGYFTTEPRKVQLIFSTLDISLIEPVTMTYAIKRGVVPLKHVRALTYRNGDNLFADVQVAAENHATLSAVDLSQCWTLTDVSALEACTNLTMLNLSGSGVYIDSLQPVIPKLTNLKHFKYVGQGEDVENANSWLLKDISTHWSNISHLCVKSQALGNEGAKILFGIQHLHTINLSDNGITHDNNLWELISPNLKAIHLNDNPIGDDAVLTLAENSTLVELHVKRCGVTSRGVSAVLYGNIIKKLSVGGNVINDAAFEGQQESVLTWLNVSHVSGLSSQVIAGLPQLNYLNISHNPRIDLRPILRHLKYLQHLDASYCELFDDDLQATIASQELSTLVLAGNNFTDVSSLVSVPTLTRLKLQSNDLRNEGVAALLKSQYIQELDLAYNLSLDDTCLENIVENTVLASLNLGNCTKLGERAELLLKNVSLTSLQLEHTKVTESILQQFLYGNHTLRRIDLSGISPALVKEIHNKCSHLNEINVH